MKGSEGSVDRETAGMSPMVDRESEALIQLLDHQEKIRSFRVPGVRTVLVVLSSRGIVYDVESLRTKILISYPDAAVFFRNTRGDAMGAPAPSQVDLLIDLTGPGQRQGLLMAHGLRKMARVAVGRNAGLFRKRIYDRVFDEKSNPPGLPKDLLQKERYVQRQVLELAGIPLAQQGDPLQDLGRSIALNLPPMQRM